MTRTRTTVLSGTLLLLAAAVALTLVILTGQSSGGTKVLRLGAGGAGLLNKEAKAGEGPAAGYEAYRSAARTYPANTISLVIPKRRGVGGMALHEAGGRSSSDGLNKQRMRSGLVIMQAALAIVLLAGATTLVVAAYVAASRREVDGTTEVAALVLPVVRGGMEHAEVGRGQHAERTDRAREHHRLDVVALDAEPVDRRHAGGGR